MKSDKQVQRPTDADVARSAQNMLRWTSYLPPEAITVQVENGWITLSGQVVWEFQRKAATEAVRHLMGVTGVSDQIAIKPGVSATIVKSDIEAALKRRAQSHADGISVEVRGNDVTLTGIVNSWWERHLAMGAAWGAPGVHKVMDSMSVDF
jgi:osmotically-inducible protein OsmY